MRYLFIHPVFPGQFHRVMESLAADPQNQVVHLSRQSTLSSVPGVRKLRYTLPETSAPQSHSFMHKMEDAVRQAEAADRILTPLKQQGFTPDLIYGYAGWGPTMFLKDIFPGAPFAGYFEWYLNPFGSEYNFDPDHPLSRERQQYLHVFNAPLLMDLQACDYGLTPTRWQHHQFPVAYRDKIEVLHDGVDTGYYRPEPDAGLNLPGIRLPPGVPVVTYATRGMEPFRGFPQFMKALALLQQRHPDCHAVIVGSDQVYYSRTLPDGRSYKQQMLEELAGQLDISRIHFTGWLSNDDYRRVLQVSRAHVYLTYPYVLSWSMLEAMATGCLVIASDTAPVKEVIRHGDNGLLVDFFDYHSLATLLEDALRRPAEYHAIRDRARRTVEEHYELNALTRRHEALLKRWAGAPLPAGRGLFRPGPPPH